MKEFALDRSQADALRLASQMCATLAAVDQAHLTGHDDVVQSLLAGIDPIEARHTANTLQALWRLWLALPVEERGGPTGVVQGGSRSPLPPGVSAAGSSLTTDDGKQPSAPGYPQVVHAFDTWSRKSPCA